MNKTREEIKWAPFESLTSSKETIHDLEYKRLKQPKPILSEDEYLVLNDTLITAYHTKEQILITYYQEGYIYQKETTIKEIKKNHNLMILKDNTSLYLEQLLDIKIL